MGTCADGEMGMWVCGRVLGMVVGGVHGVFGVLVGRWGFGRRALLVMEVCSCGEMMVESWGRCTICLSIL